MRLVFMGTPEFSVPVLNRLHAEGHDIAAVYCQPPRPAGRGKRERPSPVHLRAVELGLEVRHPARLSAPEVQQDFADLQAEVAVVVAYGLLLPQVVLDAPTRGCLNIHASLLPRWRGAAPIHRAIMAGDPETGVCIMQMEAGLDTGPVLLQQSLPIAPQDTTGTLHDRLSDLGADLIARALDTLDDLQPQPQPDQGVTYAKKVEKSETRVDWHLPATEIDRQIRGLSPFPGAWCEIGGERIKLLSSRVVEGTGQPGAHLGGLTVACGEGAVQIVTAQRAGKRALPAEDFCRGLDLGDDTLFE